jgi:mono/diheme cytochrome c family protein
MVETDCDRFFQSVTLRERLSAAVVVVILCWSGAGVLHAAPDGERDDAEPLFFEDHVAPLLQEHCHYCHNPDDHEGQLDLTTAEGLLKGSESGPIVTPKNRNHSLIYEVLHGGEMPPGDRLSEEEIKLIGDWIAGGAQFRDPPEAALKPPSQHDVLPILLLRCTACHGAELQRNDLDLRSIAGLKQGGVNGPAAVSGDPDASPMIQRVERQECPPHGELLKYFVERPSETEVETLRNWIAAGMIEEEVPEEVLSGMPDRHVTDEHRQHWAFQPLPKEIPVPEFAGVELAQPIDAFIYRRLVEEGLDFSPPASKTELIRRVYLDLTGIPPTLEELDRWEQHPSGDWYAEMVEHLLASPRYGERWGRYWLDVAGYADSEGGTDADPVREFAWKYRDYVIRSFNDDKPWDRFLLEQLAGDELADYSTPEAVTDEVVDNLIATGFLRMGVDETGSRTMNFVPERLGLISNALDVVSTGMMGLTMECARCHSHKYDPIPQTDYYRFKAIFQGAFDEHDWMSWKTRQLDVATPEMIAEHKEVNSKLDGEIKELNKQRAAAIKELQDRYYEENWPKLSEELQEEITEARKARAGRRTLRQNELIQRYETEIRPTEEVLVEKHPELGETLAELDERIADLEERVLPPLTIRALWDRGRPSPTYVLIRGEHNRPGRLVGPGVPSVLTDSETPFKAAPPWEGADSTGRRLALARWLADPDHPLTARVLVNRVWHHHFGRGIVKTLDNFGKQGAEPTHPELLDWLAREFVNRGWSLKSLHRMILLSRTYRQSSSPTGGSPASAGNDAPASHDDDPMQTDPENKLLSRMTLRRLDAEALRDSLLAVSGCLDDRMYGPPSPVEVRADGLIMEQTPRVGQYRRSVYLRLRRTEMPSLLSNFDYPEMQPNCNERTTSTVSTQSLILLNNARIHELAGCFADRILESVPDAGSIGDDEMVRLVYRSAYSRSPTPEELEEAVQAWTKLREGWVSSGMEEAEANRLALASFCHTILNSAEFVYVD